MENLERYRSLEIYGLKHDNDSSYIITYTKVNIIKYI